MGVAAYCIYHGLYMILPVSRVALLVAIGIGALIYFAMILLMGGITEKELRMFPKGTMMVHFAKKLHLLK